MSESLLDVKGMNCPLPVLRANRVLRSMAPGERLRVLATDLDPETIKPKRVYRRGRYFRRNELFRLCLGIFRTATEPISVADITDQVIAAKGFEECRGGGAGV